MLELMEIIKLMIELSDESFQEAVVSLRMNKSLSKEFVDLLIDYTSSERTKKNKTIQTAQPAHKNCLTHKEYLVS